MKPMVIERLSITRNADHWRARIVRLSQESVQSAHEIAGL